MSLTTKTSLHTQQQPPLASAPMDARHIWIGAVACYFIIKSHPTPDIWPTLPLIIASLGILIFLMRLHREESPLWLLDHGQEARTEKNCRKFFCNKVTLDPVTSDTKPAQSPQKSGFADLFKGKNLVKVLFSGIPMGMRGSGSLQCGVFLTPELLHAGGMVLVLWACIGD